MKKSEYDTHALNIEEILLEYKSHYNLTNEWMNKILISILQETTVNFTKENKLK